MFKLFLILLFLLNSKNSNSSVTRRPSAALTQAQLINSPENKPIILPALATMPDASDVTFNKKKNNFSHLALELVHENFKTAPDPDTLARSVVNNGNEFCHDKTDGLYDDPATCEKFIICYVQQTFRTKCADGTKWNHHTKECDYPVLVDCSRGTTTTTTTTTTSTRRTLIRISKKYNPPTSTVMVPKLEKQDRQKIKMDILLTIILVPVGLFLLIIIILVLWFIKNKYEKENKKEEVKPSTLRDTRSLESSMAKSKSNFFYCCRKQTKELTEKNPTFNTTAYKTQKTDISKINRSEISSNVQPGIPYSITNNYDHVNKLIHGTGCPPVSKSRETLSSHFEENNWDYNFAMRGLYLTQPWVKGNYTNPTAFDSEGSVTDRPSKSSESSVYKKRAPKEHGGSDTDGFYAKNLEVL